MREHLRVQAKKIIVLVNKKDKLESQLTELGSLIERLVHTCFELCCFGLLSVLAISGRMDCWSKSRMMSTNMFKP